MKNSRKLNEIKITNTKWPFCSKFINHPLKNCHKSVSNHYKPVMQLLSSQRIPANPIRRLKRPQAKDLILLCIYIYIVYEYIFEHVLYIYMNKYTLDYIIIALLLTNPTSCYKRGSVVSWVHLPSRHQPTL